MPYGEHGWYYEPPTDKRCPHCGETKPLEAFHRASHTTDGRQGWCASCVNEYRRKGRARRADVDS